MSAREKDLFVNPLPAVAIRKDGGRRKVGYAARLGTGSYSFLDGSGELNWLDYSTRAEAEAEMERRRNAPPFDPKAYAARKAAREASFAPCDNK